jgi:hypothetical protein
MFLQAAQPVAELQQRASFDTGALLVKLIEGAPSHRYRVPNMPATPSTSGTKLAKPLPRLTAFGLLKRVSQESNTPVVQLAEQVISGDHTL